MSVRTEAEQQLARSAPPVTARLRALVAGGNGWIFLVLVAMIAVFSVISPGHVFFSVANFKDVLISASGLMILGAGMTLVIVAGQIDLSIGSILVLSASASVNLMDKLTGSGWPVELVLVVGIAVSLLVGMAVGLVNGLLTTRVGVPSFIVTLGTLGIALGLAQVITDGYSQAAPQELVDGLGLSSVLGIPTVVLVGVAIVAVVGLLLAKTEFGLHCYAVGSNREAARRAGVAPERVIVGCFVLMGLLCGIAGVIDLARFSTESASSHQTDNLSVIAAVIIGGTSLYGGRGTVWGTVIGTLIPAVLVTGLVIQGVQPYWQGIAIGAILILAVAIDQRQRVLALSGGGGR